MESRPNDVESVLTGWHEQGDTVAFSRVGIGVALAFAGKVFPTQVTDSPF